MPEEILIIILKLVEWELNRREKQDQKKISPSSSFVNNGTINIEIHMDKN